MNTQDLTNYKSKYLGIEIPTQILQKRWEELASVLPLQKREKPYYRYMRMGAVFLSLLVVILAGTVGISQGSKPGEALYSVKTLTGKISTGFITSIQTQVGKVFPNTIKHPKDEADIQPTPSTDEQEASQSESKNSDAGQIQEVQNRKQQGNSDALENKPEGKEVKGTSNQNLDNDSTNSHSTGPDDNSSQASSPGQDSGSKTGGENDNSHKKNP